MVLPDAPSSVEMTLNVEKLAALEECKPQGRISESDALHGRVMVHCFALLAHAILSGLLAVAKAIERRK